MRIWHFEQDGCVDHYIVADDLAQASAIMVGQCMNMGGSGGCDPQDVEAEWTAQERARSSLDGVSWWDDKVGCRRPALAVLDDNDGPAYVACSEY